MDKAPTDSAGESGAACLAELERAEGRYRSLFEGIADGIIIHDLQGRILDVNRVTSERLGYRVEKLRQMRLRDIVSPEFTHEIAGHVEEVICGETLRFETEYVARDGRRIPCEVMERAVEHEGRDAIQSVARDITQRRQADAALRESEEKYRTLFEDSQEPMSITRDGKIADVNPAWLRLHGFKTKREVAGMDIIQIVYLEDQHILEERRRMSADERKRVYQIKDVRKDGAVIDVELLSTPIVLGGEGAILTTVRDITERKQLGEQLLRAQKMESVGTLATGVAHNFNNILGIILGNAELAKLELGDSHEALSFLDKVVGATQRAASLAQQLLSVARKQSPRRAPIDVSGLVRTVSQALRMMLDSNIQVAHRVAEGIPQIVANQAEIEQVIMNICVNARDAMPKGGTITIDVRAGDLLSRIRKIHKDLKPGEYVCVSISDTGVGMGSHTLTKIFDPFFTTKGPDRGIGLGLSTAHGAVAGHGGCIDVESKLGEGATFRVYLPAAETYEAPADPEGHEATRGGSETILVVDDEHDIAETICRGLKSLGYTVITASNGKGAVQTYRREQGRIDLVLLDYMMPQMDGEDTYRALKKLDPTVKIVITSGYDEDSKVKPLLRAEVHGFLHKPFSLAHLSQVLRCTMDRE